MRRVLVATTLAATAVLFAAGAQATVTITPVSATASSSYPGYPAADAVDTGAGSQLTDWASASQGVGSSTVLDLGSVLHVSSANVTDRVTSGSSNGAFKGGTTDFTTSFSLQACANAACTVLLGAPEVFNKATPVNPMSPSDFLDVVATNLTGRYIDYTVLATNGPNPGLSNITFGVPEPTTWALLLMGMGAIGSSLRSRRTRLA